MNGPEIVVTVDRDGCRRRSAGDSGPECRRSGVKTQYRIILVGDHTRGLRIDLRGVRVVAAGLATPVNRRLADMIVRRWNRQARKGSAVARVAAA